MSPGLSPKINRQLHETLLGCGPFGNEGELQALFSDARIASWRHRLPEANSADARVATMIDFLNARQNQDGENALVLFLRVLAERTPGGDRCHQQLLLLADRIEAEGRQRQQGSFSPPGGTAHSGSPEVPVELGEKVAAGEIAVFAGHGLSEAAGLPSRAELARSLAARLDEELPTGSRYEDGQALPDVAQLYEVARGRHALLTYLRDAFDTTSLQPATLHRAIARLPAGNIFSTTYDNLLERALREAGRRVNRVISDTMLPHAAADRVQLLKLKGDVEMPETVVVTRRDLEAYPVSHPLIVNQLRDRLSSMTFLLLGYEPDDPDLKLLFEQSGYQAGTTRLHYALMPGVSPLQQQLFRSRQIRVVDVAPEDLAAWLATLANIAGK